MSGYYRPIMIRKYKRLEEKYPGFIILQKERFMYVARGESADVLRDILGYEIVEPEEGERYTGGPDAIKIENALENFGYNYIVSESGEITKFENGVKSILKTYS